MSKYGWVALALLALGLAALAVVLLWPAGADLTDLEQALEDQEQESEASGDVGAS